MDLSKPAVVLVSGGLDSATALAIAVSEGFSAHALSIDYGQRHRAELDAARNVCSSVGAAAHIVISVDLRAFGGSALTDDIDVPHYPGHVHPGPVKAATGIPVTYVPARNTIFLSLALAWSEVLGSDDIFIGANAIDYSGYPDCRPEYLSAFAAMANLATKAAVEGRHRVNIRAPLSHLSKAQIIKKGLELGVDYSLTSSCYEPGPGGEACGTCDSCLLRAKGFSELGLEDPASSKPRPAPRL